MTQGDRVPPLPDLLGVTCLPQNASLTWHMPGPGQSLVFKVAVSFLGMLLGHLGGYGCECQGRALCCTPLGEELGLDQMLPIAQEVGRGFGRDPGLPPLRANSLLGERMSDKREP